MLIGGLWCLKSDLKGLLQWLIAHPDNQSSHGGWTLAKCLKASESVLGASCYDWGWSGCNQANRENDGREEIVKSSGAEIVKRTWTEIRVWQETVVIWWTVEDIDTVPCCRRMLTLPCSLTNTDQWPRPNCRNTKSKQYKNINTGEKKYVLLEPDGDKRGG